MAAVKKPSGELIGIALDELAVEVERRALALMVGDQHFTDIAGANWRGFDPPRSSRSGRELGERGAPWPVFAR
jgi:hypothetical protein